jgi:regulator of cell morphogenesis and NO signaling
MLPHLQHEEEIIFPYIRQIAHAYDNKESYAGLLVRTLRKPVENVMHHEHEAVHKILGNMRQLTNHYTPPQHACTNHKVTFLKLLEIDNDLTQHMYLENDILFPRAIEMEKKLLRL